MAIQLKLDDRTESPRRLLLNEPIHPGAKRSLSLGLPSVNRFHLDSSFVVTDVRFEIEPMELESSELCRSAHL